ncbi:TasA family protein [Neobacillus niacini]|uniref:TasA family protein n=1 Tax=Neobacillus niacini TaxID=86668 RepID=UPI0039830103
MIQFKTGVTIYLIFLITVLLFQVPSMVTEASKNEGKIDISTNPSMIFDIKNMKPGDEENSTFTILNKGDFDFKYHIKAGHESGSIQLFNNLIFSIREGDNEIFNGPFNDFNVIESRILKKKTQEPLIFSVKLPIQSGNEYQGLSTKVKFDFIAEGDTSVNIGNNNLPNTATNSFNLVFIGLLLIVLGSIFYLIRRKKVDV